MKTSQPMVASGCSVSFSYLWHWSRVLAGRGPQPCQWGSLCQAGPFALAPCWAMSHGLCPVLPLARCPPLAPALTLPGCHVLGHCVAFPGSCLPWPLPCEQHLCQPLCLPGLELQAGARSVREAEHMGPACTCTVYMPCVCVHSPAAAWTMNRCPTFVQTQQWWPHPVQTSGQSRWMPACGGACMHLWAGSLQQRGSGPAPARPPPLLAPRHRGPWDLHLSWC